MVNILSLNTIADVERFFDNATQIYTKGLDTRRKDSCDTLMGLLEDLHCFVCKVTNALWVCDTIIRDNTRIKGLDVETDSILLSTLYVIEQPCFELQELIDLLPHLNRSQYSTVLRLFKVLYTYSVLSVQHLWGLFAGFYAKGNVMYLERDGWQYILKTGVANDTITLLTEYTDYVQQACKARELARLTVNGAVELFISTLQLRRNFWHSFGNEFLVKTADYTIEFYNYMQSRFVAFETFSSCIGHEALVLHDKITVEPYYCWSAERTVTHDKKSYITELKEMCNFEGDIRGVLIQVAKRLNSAQTVAEPVHTPFTSESEATVQFILKSIEPWAKFFVKAKQPVEKVENLDAVEKLLDFSEFASTGVIYILTNPAFPQYIKIGYTDDLCQRVQQLNSKSSVPCAFRVYAIYEVDARLQDLQLHRLIDTLNPNLRVKEVVDGNKRVREFYEMSPESAYTLLETIASLNGSLDKLHKFSNSVFVAG